MDIGDSLTVPKVKEVSTIPVRKQKKNPQTPVTPESQVTGAP
ncbi:hypothetical protein [Paenibacillus sp. FSL H8-0034]